MRVYLMDRDHISIDEEREKVESSEGSSGEVAIT